MEIDKLGLTKKEEKGERKRKKIINGWKKKATGSRQSILFFWGFFGLVCLLEHLMVKCM